MKLTAYIRLQPTCGMHEASHPRLCAFMARCLSTWETSQLHIFTLDALAQCIASYAHTLSVSEANVLASVSAVNLTALVKTEVKLTLRVRISFGVWVFYPR